MSACKHNLGIAVNRRGSSSGLHVADAVVAIKDDGVNSITRFLERTKALIVSQGIVPNPNALPLDCGLLLLGVISATEAYMRDVVGEMASLCSIARGRLSDLSLTYGAADYYGSTHMARCLWQGQSLAGAEELRRLIGRIGGTKIKEGDQIWVAADEFETVCHVRHALVHAYGELGLNNLNKIKVSGCGGPVLVRVDNSLFQTASIVCTNLVRVVNQFLFDRTVSGWIDEGKLCGVWKDDKQLWEVVWRAFVTGEKEVPRSAYLGWLKIRGKLVARSQSHSAP